jgi:hypothetical protein
LSLPNPDYAALPEYARFLEQVDDNLRAEALARFFPTFETYYKRQLGLPRPDYEARIGEGDALLSSLQEAGCAACAISAAGRAELTELALPLADDVHARLEGRDGLRFKDTQRVLSPEEHVGIYAAVDRVLTETRIHEVFAAYCRRPLRLKDVTVQVTTQRHTAADYGPLDQDGLPSPRTRYMHIDSALHPQVKVLIYLSPVGPDQGPFRYVQGSHRGTDDFELIVRKVNDQEKIRDRLFMALPEPFRMYTLFGDHIDPDSAEAQALLAREKAFDDGLSDLILFDFNGVHRGGFVREGKRYMLQCHFAPLRK